MFTSTTLIQEIQSRQEKLNDARQYDVHKETAILSLGCLTHCLCFNDNAAVVTASQGHSLLANTGRRKVLKAKKIIFKIYKYNPRTKKIIKVIHSQSPPIRQLP